SIILTKLRQLCPFGQRQRLVLHATLLFRPIYPVLQRVLMNAKTLRNLRDRTTGINNQGNRLGLIPRSELPPTRHPSSSYIPVNLKSTVNGSGTTSGGITQARARLGSGPVAEVFETVAVPVAGELTPGAWLGSWRLM